MGSKRIEHELKALEKDPPTGTIACYVDNEDLYHWNATIQGPAESPFAGGAFQVSIFFPIDYPFKPPKVKFRTKIFHPNIEEDGIIYLSILMEEWSPALTMSDVLQAIFELLNEPNLEYIVVKKIADMYKNDKDEYEKTALSWTEQYATD